MKPQDMQTGFQGGVYLLLFEDKPLLMAALNVFDVYVFQSTAPCEFSLMTNCSFFSVSLWQITSVINPALDKYFPSDSGVRIIAEPGRYYVASAFTLAVNIIAKKLVLKEQTGSDGRYQD